MRVIRPLFFVKCFLFGFLVRFFIFFALIFWRRLYPNNNDAYGESSFLSDKRIGNALLSSYVSPDFGERMITSNNRKSIIGNDEKEGGGCTMSKCFNFTRCRDKPFKVHIYPTSVLEQLLQQSATNNDNNSSSSSPPIVISAYTKILWSIIHSGYYTSDPDRACLFVVAYDTLDRDLLSADYVKNLQSKFAALPRSVWNNGRNHLIFNLYQGTWPNYDVTDLGIDSGEAIFVKASFSITHFRPWFDISFPLFHRILPTTTSSWTADAEIVVSTGGKYGRDDHQENTRYLFSFKGKRYVHGIGSETRNSLYHLHNPGGGGGDSVVVTTCRHGRNWHQAKDERCDQDNEAYDRYGAYEWLLSLSDFCLVPRGRRLGSYRFLEALQYGCVPTILANDWELPFSEIVAWSSEAAVFADERLLSAVPDALHEIKATTAFKLRANAKRLSRAYFSSVERIVATTLQIVERRLRPWASSALDNNPLSTSTSSSSPFWGRTSLTGDASNKPRFHAYVIVSATKRSVVSTKRLIDSVAASKFCSQITILCFDCGVLIAKSKWPVPVKVIRLDQHDRDWPPPVSENTAGEYDALFWINALQYQQSSTLHISTDEIDFAMQVWRWFPDRLVGFFCRRFLVLQNRNDNGGNLSSKLLNDFTFLTGAAILYRTSYYEEELNSLLRSIPDVGMRLLCFDRILNRIAARRGKTPIKLTARYQQQRQQGIGKSESSAVLDADCFPNNDDFEQAIHRSSKVRFDPLLYKDPVSNLRKKYKQMEL